MNQSLRIRESLNNASEAKIMASEVEKAANQLFNALDKMDIVVSRAKNDGLSMPKSLDGNVQAAYKIVKKIVDDAKYVQV